MSDRPFAFLTRRRVIGAGLAAGSAALMGGGLVALRGAAPANNTHVLSAHEHRTASAIARAHLPRGGPFEIGADDVDLSATLDAFLAGEPTRNVEELKLALLLVEYGPLLFDGRLTTFSNLADEEKTAHWNSWATSSLLVRRKVSTAFRKIFSLVFFDHEQVWPHIGYPGPSLQVRR
jgi:hypothetical protein